MMVVTLVENSLINERWRACYLTKPFNDEELLSYLRIVVPDSSDVTDKGPKPPKST